LPFPLSRLNRQEKPRKTVSSGKALISAFPVPAALEMT